MKIKPCPFCGNEAELWEEVYEGMKVFSVACSYCGAGTDHFDNPKEPVKNWNKRIKVKGITFNDEGLLPCPCCGAEASPIRINIVDEDLIFDGYCPKCTVSGEGAVTKQKAIQLWNKRRSKHENSR